MDILAAIAGRARSCWYEIICGATLLEAAGHWQGVWKISEVYLYVHHVFAGRLFLATSAETERGRGAARELGTALLNAVPVVASAGADLLAPRLGSVTLYSGRVPAQ